VHSAALSQCAAPHSKATGHCHAAARGKEEPPRTRPAGSAPPPGSAFAGQCTLLERNARIGGKLAVATVLLASMKPKARDKPIVCL
jgi:hypothetical protein